MDKNKDKKEPLSLEEPVLPDVDREISRVMSGEWDKEDSAPLDYGPFSADFFFTPMTEEKVALLKVFSRTASSV